MSKLDALISLEYGEPLPAERRTGHGFPVFGSNGEVGRHQSALIAGPGIVVGRKGSVGKVTWSDNDFWPIDTTYWVNCPPEERRWLYWVLSWLPLHLLDTSTGIPGLNRRDVYELEVYRPEFGERRKIAQILDILDTAIRETEALIDKLKALKQGLLQDLLTRGIDANGQLRPRHNIAPQLYKQSPLGWIPRGWDVVKLGAVLSELGQGWSPDCPSEPAEVSEWGVLKTTSVVWEGYNENENKRLPVPFKPRPDLEVKSDDILITRAGPKSRVGVVVHVPSTRPQLMISDKIYRLRLLGSEVPAYFALALSAEYMQSAISRTVSGMAESQTNISQGAINGLMILRPMRDEQKAIVEHARFFDERLRAEASNLSKLQAQKNGLVDDLLTGRVRITPLLESMQPSAAPTEA